MTTSVLVGWGGGGPIVSAKLRGTQTYNAKERWNTLTVMILLQFDSKSLDVRIPV